MKFCFNGCSFTVGEGFDVGDRDSYVYDRLLQKRFGFERHNIASGGASNHVIFMRSARAIMCGDYDCVVTQWSGLNRIWFCPGPDSQFFSNSDNQDFKYREIYLDQQQLQKFKNTLLMLNGDYNNIIDLVTFCNILSKLAAAKNVKKVFVNGLVHWTDDLIKPLGHDLYSSLSDYSKQLLDFDHRDDEEIQRFFKHLQNEFATLDRDLWVNLFDPWIRNIIDNGPLGHHPGVLSNQLMADKTAEYLLKKKII
jgi:hypothetical protein